MEEVVKYQCMQCEVVHRGTEANVPVCIFCSTSERMKRLESDNIYQIVIDYGHKSSNLFFADERTKKKIQTAFISGEKITLNFWKKELDINMEFVQDIQYELLSPKRVNSFETSMMDNLDEYGVTYNQRRVLEDWE